MWYNGSIPFITERSIPHGNQGYHPPPEHPPAVYRMNRQLWSGAASLTREALAFLPPDTGLLWFARLCALRAAAARGLCTDLPDALGRLHRQPLFADAGDPPPGLGAALDALGMIPDADFRDEPLLPGWLLEAYRSPDRKAAFSGARARSKLGAAELPAATQLFTPRYLADYMVHNALACVCPDVPAWHDTFPPAGIPRRDPRCITLLGPCMGTGHILLPAFDALMELRCAAGESPADAAVHILNGQLFGLEIDPLAAALCFFHLTLHAARFVPGLLTDPPKMHLCDFAGDPDPDAPLIGSLLPGAPARPLLDTLYDCVVTNPPYMGAAAMAPALARFVQAQFPDSKADLCTCFIERCAALTRPDGAFALLTQHSWMFLPRLQRLREKLLHEATLQSLVHLGTGAFGDADIGTIVQAVSFTAVRTADPDFPTVWLRLVHSGDKQAAFADASLRYTLPAARLESIPGRPLSYWVSESLLRVMQMPPLSGAYRICQGMTTSDNRRFVRRWFEVRDIAFGCRSRTEAAATGMTWFPYNKGGRVRRWYGNHTHVVNFRDDGAEMRAFHEDLAAQHAGGRIKNADMYFRPGITWSFITESRRFGVRLMPAGFLFDVSGSCLFPPEEDLYYLMGLLSSGTVARILELYNPTMNFQAETIGRLPVLHDAARKPLIESLVHECIALARADWDETEESWDFRVHPLLLQGAPTLRGALSRYQVHCAQRYARMAQLEQRISALAAQIYGLPGDDPPGPPTLCRHTDESLSQALVSFAAGCMFGRYTFPCVAPLPDGIAPAGTLYTYVCRVLEAAFGREHLPENLATLSEGLGEEAALYCRRDFWRIHSRRYHKRPIYWLAVSGRRREAAALVYVHGVSSPLAAVRRYVESLPHGTERDAYLARILSLDPAGEPGEDAGIHERLRYYRGVFRQPV